MPNMSYCRFQNTLPDLAECRDELDEETVENKSLSERKAAIRLIRICEYIAERYGGEYRESLERDLSNQ